MSASRLKKTTMKAIIITTVMATTKSFPMIDV
jgi:hypothetical protein